MTASCAYEGWVRHRRFEPLEHGFRYPLLMMYLDLDELPEVLDGALAWSARRPAPARFRRKDYLGDPARPLRDEVLALVKRRTGRSPGGPVRVLTQLRQLGFCFNPVSFYYCFDPGGRRVEAVAAEVTSTPWLERHTYVLERDGDGPVLSSLLPKRLHVSPFLGMDSEYEWRLSEPDRALQVHIESRTSGRRVFDATLALERRDLSPRLLLRHPATSLAVAARIYFQALRLRLRGAPHFPRPR